MQNCLLGSDPNQTLPWCCVTDRCMLGLANMPNAEMLPDPPASTFTLLRNFYLQWGVWGLFADCESFFQLFEKSEERGGTGMECWYHALRTRGQRSCTRRRKPLRCKRTHVWPNVCVLVIDTCIPLCVCLRLQLLWSWYCSYISGLVALVMLFSEALEVALIILVDVHRVLFIYCWSLLFNCQSFVPFSG